MARSRPLPATLVGTAFDLRTGRAHGLSDDQMRNARLRSPFVGIRIASTEELTLPSRCRAYSIRMRPFESFSHSTAALLYGVPLPRWAEHGPLHITAVGTERVRRPVGVVGHSADAFVAPPCRVGGVRVVSPEDLWLQLATMLQPDDLTVAGDFLVTGDEPYSKRLPVTTIARLKAITDARAGARGIRTARHALERVRYGSLSPQETRMRLLMMRAGLPEPALNFEVFVEGIRVAMIDAAYPEELLGVEYQGDQHRTDAEVFAADIRRRERLEDLGWRLVYVSKEDLARHSPAFIGRVRELLRRRAPHGR